MKIVSDFHDWYDLGVSSSNTVFTRMTKSGPDKAAQFRIIESAGFHTPKHGVFEDIAGCWWDQGKKRLDQVVVYTDLNAHCTEGKQVIDLMKWKSNPHMGMPGGDRYHYERQAVSKLYCSAFVGNYYKVFSGGSESLRRLQIGPHVFWIEYKSTESWMSNYGEGSVDLVGVELDVGPHPQINYPLHAIDFVIADEMYGVDFNIAPGTSGAGITRYLTSSHVCDAIESCIRRDQNN